MSISSTQIIWSPSPISTESSFGLEQMPETPSVSDTTDGGGAAANAATVIGQNESEAGEASEPRLATSEELVGEIIFISDGGQQVYIELLNVRGRGLNNPIAKPPDYLLNL